MGMKRPPPEFVTPELQRENRQLRGLLLQVREDGAYNQQVMARLQERELLLLSAGNLLILLERLTAGMRASFRLDAVKLVLLDPFGVIRDLLRAAGDAPPAALRDIELCTEVQATKARFEDLHQPRLGPWDPARHASLFGRRLGSVAVLPLRQVDGLAGFLCLGSRDPQRFEADRATDFLAHLARVAAVCLENAVNRERLRVAGLTDGLTGLYNRRHLQHRLEQELNRAARHGHSLACLFIDADHFKRINDEYGHAAGDLVLVALAQRLRAHLRSSDLAARYGGEEFALLLPQTDAASACHLAERIRCAVAEAPIALDDGQAVGLTVSIGVAAVTGQVRQSADRLGAQLLQDADRAVYRAKAAGRNRVVCASCNEDG